MLVICDTKMIIVTFTLYSKICRMRRIKSSKIDRTESQECFPVTIKLKTFNTFFFTVRMISLLISLDTIILAKNIIRQDPKWTNGAI